MDNQDTFRAYLAAAAKAGTQGATCIRENDLLAHLRGTLNQSDTEVTESHLVGCSACRQRLLDLKDFLDPSRDGEEPLMPEALRQDWRLMRNRVAGGRVTFLRSRQMSTLAVAASLLIMAGLSAGWVLSTRASALENAKLRRQAAGYEQELAELRRPRINTGIHDVYSAQTLSRSGNVNNANQINVRPDVPLTLILNGHGLETRPHYSITIMDVQGHKLWHADNLERNSDGNFVLTLNNGFLVQGDYVIRVSPLTPTGETTAVDYRITLHYK